MIKNKNKIIKGKGDSAFSYFKNNNHKLLKSKKAETIGTTWDMVIAFFVIMFLLAIFLTISFLIAEKKIWLGGTDSSLINYQDNLNSQTMLFSLMNSPIYFKDKQEKVKDILTENELYNLDENTKYQLRDLIKNQTLKLIGNTTNKCYIFQAIYGIKDTKQMSNVDLRGAQYVRNFIEKNTLAFSSAPDNVDVRVAGYVNSQVNKWLEKGANIILVRNITTNLYGVDEGEKQKIYIKFYNGECLG